MISSGIAKHIINVMYEKNLPRLNLIACITILGNFMYCKDSIVEVK